MKRLHIVEDDDRLDAIVFPHQKRPVVPVGETQVERNGALGSVTGLIEIGCGYEQATKHRRPPPSTPPLEASLR